jgi:hypothetical protein
MGQNAPSKQTNTHTMKSNHKKAFAKLVSVGCLCYQNADHQKTGHSESAQRIPIGPITTRVFKAARGLMGMLRKSLPRSVCMLIGNAPELCVCAKANTRHNPQK